MTEKLRLVLTDEGFRMLPDFREPDGWIRSEHNHDDEDFHIGSCPACDDYYKNVFPSRP